MSITHSSEDYLNFLFVASSGLPHGLNPNFQRWVHRSNTTVFLDHFLSLNPLIVFDIDNRTYSSRPPVGVFFFQQNIFSSLDFRNQIQVFLISQDLCDQTKLRLACFDMSNRFCFYLPIFAFSTLVCSELQLDIKLEIFNNKYYFT
jgi:hypothetical protein